MAISHYIFVSYSRRDESTLRRILAHLREQGLSVWVDNEFLTPGTPMWEEEIEKAIVGASAMVVLLSPDSKKSEWVRAEINYAKQNRKRVYPVLIGGDENSSVPLGLLSHQFGDLRTNEERGLQELTRLLQAYFNDLTEREKAEQEAAERERAVREKMERDAAEKEAQEQAKREAEEKAAKEKAAKSAVRKAAREQAKRLAAEPAAKEKAEQEAAEKNAQAKAKREVEELTAPAEAERIAAEKVKQENLASLAGSKPDQAAADKAPGESEEPVERAMRKIDSQPTEIFFTRLKNTWNGWSKTKRALTITGIAVAGILLACITGFLALLLPSLETASLPADHVQFVTAGANPKRAAFNTKPGTVYDIAISPDGKIIASASYPDSVQWWNTADGALISTVEGCSIFAAAFSPDGKYFACEGPLNNVLVWAVDNGALSLLSTLSGHSESVYRIAFSSDSQTIATAAWDKTVKLWDLDGSLLRTLSGHTEWVNDVAFSPDGEILVSASNDRTLILWRVSDGKPLHIIEETSSIKGISFAPDGKTFAYSGAYLWDIANQVKIDRFYGGGDIVAFSTDGAMLAAGKSDGTINIWKVSDGTALGSVAGHTGSIQSLAFSPDGNLLVSGAGDGTIRLWDIRAVTIFMPAPTAAEEIPSQPAGTRDPNPTEVMSFAGQADIKETFDIGTQQKWWTGNINNEYYDGSASISGYYVWEATKAKKDFTAWTEYEGDITDNFDVMVDVMRAAGISDKLDFGLVFRKTSDNNYYIFRVGDNGYYAVQYYNGTVWKPLIDWTPSSAILNAGWNTLRVTATGTKFDFYINGVQVNTATDATLSSGKIGIYIGFAQNQSGKIFFDNFFVIKQ